MEISKITVYDEFGPHPKDGMDEHEWEEECLLQNAKADQALELLEFLATASGKKQRKAKGRSRTIANCPLPIPPKEFQFGDITVEFPPKPWAVLNQIILNGTRRINNGRVEYVIKGSDIAEVVYKDQFKKLNDVVFDINNVLRDKSAGAAVEQSRGMVILTLGTWATS
jgi:hypothetical protein